MLASDGELVSLTSASSLLAKSCSRALLFPLSVSLSLLIHILVICHPVASSPDVVPRWQTAESLSEDVFFYVSDKTLYQSPDGL